MIVKKPEQHIAGLAHFSLGLYEVGVDNLILELERQLEQHGVNLVDCQLKIFNADESLSHEINTSLLKRNISAPASEWMEAEGIRINKQTGEISFFSLIT